MRKKPNPQKAAAAVRETFRRLYNIFRRKSGFEDRFEDHPGFNQRSGKHRLSPWDRLVLAAEQRHLDLPGYVFAAMKKGMEDQNTKEFHPHFLLKAEYWDEYQRTYPTILRSIEIKWQDQRLMFDSEIQRLKSMPWFQDTSAETQEKYVLLAEDKRFSDLFIFYKAVLGGYTRLANDVKDNARFEYALFASAYDPLINNLTISERLQKNNVYYIP
jgi:hypothetical protein